jgi:hypothetical protein
MMDKANNKADEELKAWAKRQLDEAVHELMGKGIAGSMLVEAKLAWIFPFTILIGKVREQDQPGRFDWFICGDLPTDYVPSSVASTPRDAARHFALKWQLDADRQDAGSQLAEKAQALYELVDQSELWQ